MKQFLPSSLSPEDVVAGRSPDARPRIANLTGVRGFAALWVCVYHFRETTGVAQIDLGRIVQQGMLGVDLFFVLSGFILSIVYLKPGVSFQLNFTTFGDFLLKRFARIYPVHAVTFLLALGLWLAARYFGYQFNAAVQNDLWTAICNIFLIHAWGVTHELSWNHPSWSISAEWFAYLTVFFVCAIFLQRQSTRVCVVIALLAWSLFVFYLFQFRQGDIGGITTDGIIRIVPEFIGGYVAYRLIHGAAKYLTHWASIAVVVLFAALLYFLPYLALVFMLPAIMVLLLALYRGSPMLNLVFGNSTSVLLGEISYSIYMVHIFVQIAANQVARRFHIAGNMPHALLLLIAEILITIVFGYVTYRFLETPTRKAIVNFRRLDQ